MLTELATFRLFLTRPADVKYAEFCRHCIQWVSIRLAHLGSFDVRAHIWLSLLLTDVYKLFDYQFTTSRLIDLNFVNRCNF